MKKLLPIFLALSLIIFQMDTIKASADQNIYQSGDYTYSVSNSTAIITRYTGSGGNITIPSMIDRYTVTGIGNDAFDSCTSLTNITIPSSVTSIGNLAFYYCTSLKNITIPNSVTSIGDDVFRYCSNLTSITLPSSVTNIGAYEFEECSSLTSITIPNSVTSIGDGAFYNCNSLKNITIPKSVTRISNSMFYNCRNLTSVAIPSSVTSIGFNAFQNCSNLISITIPNSVTYIDSWTFCNCSKLTSIVIPSSVTSIGEGVFQNCSSLTSIIIPSSVTSIGTFAFSCCSSLTSITIPKSVTKIGNYAFSACSSLTSINADAYNTAYSSLDGVLYNKLKTTLICYPSGKINSTYVVPRDVISIGALAFSACSSLTSITISDSVTSIGNYAFGACSSLTSITIPSSVTNIGTDPFYNCPSALIIYYHNTVIGFTNPWNGYKTVRYNIVSYNGNGNTGGIVSVDNNIYTQGTQATIINNSGSLVKTGYTFSGWNTKPDGSGIGYPAGTSVSMNGADMTLYAQWTSISPSSGTFTSTTPANLTAVIAAPNKTANPVIGVYNRAAKLVIGTDAAVLPTATGYTFTLYKSYLSKLTSNTLVTLKFKDGSSLTYTVVLGATMSPSSGIFTKTTPANLTAVITAPNKTANPVIGVYNGADKLVGGTDAAVAPTSTGYTFTLYKSYLSKLTSNTPITLKFKDGSSLTYNVVLGATMSPSSGTFTSTTPANLTAVITAPNKTANPVIGVYNGADKLVGSTDEAITATSTGYTFTLYKSYLSKLTSNTPITLKFRDGSSLTYNVVLGATMSPSSGIFTKTTPANLTAVITAPNKTANPVIGVYNGADKLVGGTDEAIATTDTGYTFTLYKSYLSKLTSNSVITLKFKDGSSLTYTVVLGATMSPSSGTFTSTTPANLTAVITAPNKTANPVIGVYNGDDKLVGSTDEAITATSTGYTFTLYKSYLSKLTSNTPITLKFRDGSSLTYNVVLGATMSPSSGTFTKTAPANLTAVITAPNKTANPVIGVYNGADKLVGGTDEAIATTDTGYTFTLYKSYLSKLTSNSVITLKFKDGSSINYTVNMK